MATIAANIGGSKPLTGVTEIFWETVTTDDQGASVELGGVDGIFGSIQVTGTFNGGTTVTPQISNDNTNWVTLKDTSGTDISFTAAGMAEFSTAAKYIRVSVASGSSDDIDVRVILRK